MRKVSLIGAGNIGSVLAQRIVCKEIADVMLIDRDGDIARGKALDLLQSATVENFSVKLEGTDDISSIEGSDVVVVTAGIPRKPGMSRDDLVEVNAKVILDIACNIKKYCKDAFVIVVTNPLDFMAWLMQKAIRGSSNRVIGMAGILDSSRFNLFIANALNISPTDVNSLVLGSHGDTMIPLLRYTSVAGIPISSILKMGLLTKDHINQFVERARSGGAEIIKLLKHGSAFCAPASSTISMLTSYFNNSRRVLTCATNANGYYGIQHDIYLGLPVIIGENGVEEVWEVPLTDEERRSFDASASKTIEFVETFRGKFGF